MTTAGGGGGRFETTRWSLVIAAGGPTDGSSHDALSQLCQIYWQPLYAYLRRHGHSREDAEDLTQGFFARFLERKQFRTADPERGRFRAFLLVALQRYVINEYKSRTAARRGGPLPSLALDFDDAERTWMMGIQSDDTPERVYERKWAELSVDRVLSALRQEYYDLGKDALADALLPCLTDEKGEHFYRVISDRLAMSEGALRTAVSRMRRRFGEVLKHQIADTVDSPGDADDEIRHLLRVLGG